MTRGTLFYYQSDSKVWESTEFNGDMYHGTPENPEGIGDEVIELMTKLNKLDDFKEVLKEINEHYEYKEGNECWSITDSAIKKTFEKKIKWIDEERPALKGTDDDPRTWKTYPTFKDVNTWQFWGVPNLSDYSYVYNASKHTLVLTTKGGTMEIPSGALGVLNYGHNDCLCKDGKIIDGMGNYEVTPELTTMNKKEFYNYIIKNFTLDATTRNLVLNILDYVELQALNETDTQEMLAQLLDGIGLDDEEIKKVKFGSL